MARTLAHAMLERKHRHCVCATTPTVDEGLITFAGIEHRFMYVVPDDVVDTVIGPFDYIEQVANERRQTAHEARPPLPRKEHNQPLLGAWPAFETGQNELAQERAAAALRGMRTA